MVTVGVIEGLGVIVCVGVLLGSVPGGGVGVYVGPLRTRTGKYVIWISVPARITTTASVSSSSDTTIIAAIRIRFFVFTFVLLYLGKCNTIVLVLVLSFPSIPIIWFHSTEE